MTTTKPIPILFIDITSTFGGAINSLWHLVHALDRQRFTPVVVLAQPEEYVRQNFGDVAWHRHVPQLVWYYGPTFIRVRKLKIFRILFFNKMLSLSRIAYWLLRYTIPDALRYYLIGRRYKVGLIHVNNIMGSQLSAILAAKMLRVPCVAHLRDFEEADSITKIYAKMISHHIAISSAIRDNLYQLDIPKDQVSLVHNAIDLSKFNSCQEQNQLRTEFNLNIKQPAFGIFARIVEWKGIREFIIATSRIIKIIPTAKAFLVGSVSDGDEYFFLEMQELTKQFGIENNVIFTGYRDDVPELMQLMDVIVHASNSPEPFGRVIIEAMAACKPIVATRAGGPLDIVIDGETGYLVPMGDPEALSGAILALLQHPELREKMGVSGRIRVQRHFSSESAARKIEAIFTKLID